VIDVRREELAPVGDSEVPALRRLRSVRLRGCGAGERLGSWFVLRPEVEFAARLVERFAACKVPVEVQHLVRLEVEAVGNAITIWECRPPWREEYGLEWTRMGIARFRYSPSGRAWTVYWMRSDLKFHRYTLLDPQPGIGPLLDEVARDPHACFWG